MDPFTGNVSRAHDKMRAIDMILLTSESMIGNNAGNILGLTKMPCDPGDTNVLTQLFTRTQFLVRAGTVIMINQAQEKSFCIAVGLDLSDTVFSDVLRYAGLSRVAYAKKRKWCLSPNPDN